MVDCGGSLGDCTPVLPKGRKYQMVKTQTDGRWQSSAAGACAETMVPEPKRDRR